MDNDPIEAALRPASSSPDAGSADPIERALDPAQRVLQATAKPPAPASPPPQNSQETTGAFTGGGWEGLAKLATGVVANATAGYKGLATLATGGSLDDAVNAIHATQAGMTYEPRTQEGRDVAAVLSKPGEWIGKAGAKAGDIAYRGAEALGAPAPVKAGIATAADVGTQFFVPGAALKAAGAGLRAAGGAAAEAPAAGEAAAIGAPKGAAVGPAATFEPVPEPGPAPALTDSDMAARHAVLARIGLPTVRESAVAGDAGAAATDWQQGLLDSPDGKAMKTQLNIERSALQQHADNIVDNTGGTVGMDEASRIVKGDNIVRPLDALGDWFDGQIKGLYAAARDKAAGTSVEMPKLQALAGDESNFLGTTEGEALYKGLQARMGKLGVADSASIDSAENLRQWLNDNWTPRTSRFIGQLKNAIDDDVTSSAGEDIFQQARAMRALRERTLEDPNGIAKIIDSNGPDGINRAVPVEKIADRVTTLPAEQLNHVVNVLQNLPPELQSMGDTAVNEIKAHMANRVLDTGNKLATQWNAKGVATELRNNSSRLQRVFSPQELGQLQDLNQAGNILHVNAGYPGAVVQGANLLQRGALKILPVMGGGMGGFAGGALGFPGTGAAAGGAVGEALSRQLASRQALANVRSRIVPVKPDRGMTVEIRGVGSSPP